MRLVVRSVLIWLMVLAMPVQGIAAARMQHCATTQRPMQAPSVSAPSMHQHQHANSRSHAHAFANEASATLSGNTHIQTAGDASCSACAACCSAIAFPAVTVQILAPPPERVLAPRLVLAGDSFVPSRLERPPRSVLA